MLDIQSLFLRALEPDDIEELFTIENDHDLQLYSTHNGPYSRFMLERYIAQQHQSVYEQKQQRFVISPSSGKVLGFVDIFDFDPQSKRAGVGIVVLSQYRTKGVATKALALLEHFVIQHYDMHMLYADVLCGNKASCALFEKQNYLLIGIKRDWYFFQQKFHDVKGYQKILKT